MAEEVETPEDAPLEEPKTEEEQAKEVARAMLTDRYDDPNIVDEIVELTGLGKRVIWAIKGALARSGIIPTKKEREKQKREEPGPEEREFREERDTVPFRRPRPAYVLIEGILSQFGVRERARDLIVSRAKRAGSMHPSELERSLNDLDTGLKKREVSYITEEYYLALSQEEDVSRDIESRSYPMRTDERGRGGAYPDRFGERDYTPRGRERDYDYGGRPWERQRGGYGEQPLTMRGITDILERRERDFETRMRRSTLEDKIGSIGEDIGVLATELRNLKENPPVQSGPTGPSDYEKSLQHTIDRQDKRQDELMTLIKDERSETKEDMKELRDTYVGRVEKLQEDVKSAERRASSRSSTEGYKADEMRLAADGLNRVADILDHRGSPIKILVEGLPKWFGEGERPPLRDRGSHSSVADLVGEQYVEQ